jgi:hypothetical protein
VLRRLRRVPFEVARAVRHGGACPAASRARRGRGRRARSGYVRARAVKSGKFGQNALFGPIWP